MSHFRGTGIQEAVVWAPFLVPHAWTESESIQESVAAA